jgi:hypothetical protein
MPTNTAADITVSGLTTTVGIVTAVEHSLLEPRQFLGGRMS